MHGSLLLLTGLVAVVWRWQWRSTVGPWTARWQSALVALCLPPLMVMLSAGAVLSMGHHGTMMGWSVSPIGCWVSLGVLGFASGVVAHTLIRTAATQLRLRQYQTVTLPTGGHARCLETDLPVAAQVGLWHSSLLVSRGWLEHLTLAEQQAMVAHEQAHADYRDPLWFLGLGMIRRFSSGLPNTQALWEELLLLREIRADHRAASTSDPLLLAELLVKLSRQMTLATQGYSSDMELCVGFHESLSLSRLEQRVNALLEPGLVAEPAVQAPGRLMWLMVTLLPLTATWLHS
ncbi:M56 family metallopeptidase [Phormidium tenue]|uniref:Zn-dependent protease with chaperone function n=1 Tax=Phormidium tenue NIES-30 TaxID=549789 RepID=A0A1U7J256_9CYAN|nr:M56 family metallopeptidase [Phormidium tenue]MBD2233756.1 M56 family metallopeptidase [Phormidium tenue FACHB-1052]OKH46171.1 Zn-dependent protease with chaperone function [Phormidium tenue NIES-30]